MNFSELTSHEKILELIKKHEQPIQVAGGDVSLKDFCNEKPLDIKDISNFAFPSSNPSGPNKLCISIGKPTKAGLSERQNSKKETARDIGKIPEVIEIDSLSSVSSSPSPPLRRKMDDFQRSDRLRRSRDRSPPRRSPLRRRRSPSPAYRRRNRSRSREHWDRPRRRSPDPFSRDQLDRDRIKRRSPDYDRRRRLSAEREYSLEGERKRRRLSPHRELPIEYQRAHALHLEQERAKKKLERSPEMKELIVKRNKWEELREASQKLDKEMDEKLKYFLHRPEKHPSYSDEWKLFWNRRYKEIQQSGQDPSKYDFKPEWILFWDKRVKELHEEEFTKRKEEIKRQFAFQGSSVELQDVSPPTPDSGRHVTVDDVKNTWKQLTGGDIKGPSDKRRSLSPWEDEQSSRHSRPMSSSEGRRGLTPRGRSDISPVRNRGHMSPERNKISPARSRSNVSPSRGRSNTTPSRSHSNISPAQSRSHLSPQRSRVGNYSPPRNRSHPSPQRTRSGNFSPPRSRTNYSPSRGRNDLSPRSRRNYSPARSRGDISPHRGRREYSEPRGRSKTPSRAEPQSPSLIHCLRLCSVLEPQLGSLGPRVLELLSQAISLDKVKESASMSLLRKPEVQILFETVKEKIKGQLSLQIVPRQFVRASKDVVKSIEDMIANYKPEPSPPPETPIIVESVGMVDKVAIAQQIASVLIAQGKTDVTQDELEGLINAVVGMAQASKVNVTHAASASNFLSNINLSGALLGNTRMNQLLTSVIASSQKANESAVKTEPTPVTEQNADRQTPLSTTSTTESSKPADKKTDGGFSDEELRDKLLKFREMSRTEQNNLIALLKEMEATQPQRVESLREYAATLLAQTSKEETVKEAPKASSEPTTDIKSEKTDQSKEKMDDDDDDYSYEEIYKAASEKLNMQPAEQKVETTKTNETVTNKTLSQASSKNAFGITITEEFFTGQPSGHFLNKLPSSSSNNSTPTPFSGVPKPDSQNTSSRPNDQSYHGSGPGVHGKSQGSLLSSDKERSSMFSENSQGDTLPLLGEGVPQYSQSNFPETRTDLGKSSPQFTDYYGSNPQSKQYGGDMYGSDRGQQKSPWEVTSKDLGGRMPQTGERMPSLMGDRMPSTGGRMSTDRMPLIEDKMPAVSDRMSSTGDRMSTMNDRMFLTGDRMSAMGDRTFTGDRMPAMSERMSSAGDRMSTLSERMSSSGDRMSTMGNRVSVTGDRTLLANNRISSTGGRVSAMDDRALLAGDRMPLTGERTSSGERLTSMGDRMSSMNDRIPSLIGERYISPQGFDRMPTMNDRMTPNSERMSLKTDWDNQGSNTFDRWPQGETNSYFSGRSYPSQSASSSNSFNDPGYNRLEQKDIGNSWGRGRNPENSSASNNKFNRGGSSGFNNRFGMGMGYGRYGNN